MYAYIYIIYTYIEEWPSELVHHFDKIRFGRAFDDEMEVLFFRIAPFNSYFHTTDATVEGIIEATHVLKRSHANNFKAIFRKSSQNFSNCILGKVTRSPNITYTFKRFIFGIFWR